MAKIKRWENLKDDEPTFEKIIRKPKLVGDKIRERERQDEQRSR